MARQLLLLVALYAIFCHAHAYVSIDSNRLAAEMKYWLCGKEGETSDILLHVMAEQTMKESQTNKKAVGCATFPAAVKAVNAAVAAKKWVAPEAEEGKTEKWEGCDGATCPVTKNAVALTLETSIYIRLLEFGHEQAGDCKDPGQAIDTFVGNLIKAGCSKRVCGISDYTAARPSATLGCEAIVQ